MDDRDVALEITKILLNHPQYQRLPAKRAENLYLEVLAGVRGQLDVPGTESPKPNAPTVS